MSDQNPHTVCIIGGGISGLFTGALLSKNGYRVTVLEKNHIVGGGLQSFSRGDAMFNSGVQALVGYNENQIVKQTIRYLDNLPLHLMPTSATAQEMILVDKKHQYCMPRGTSAYLEYLVSQFPQETEGIHQLLDAIYEIGYSYDYIWLKKIQIHPEIIKYSNLSADVLIRQYIKDEMLIKLLEYIGVNVGGGLKTMSALEFSMLLMLYIEGSYRYQGGAVLCANELVNYISKHGGKIINNCEVKKIIVADRHIKYVATQNDKKYIADVFVHSASPRLLLQYTQGEIFRKSTKLRIENQVSRFSGFAIYLELKEETFPFINSIVFVHKEFNNDYLPDYIYILTPPSLNQGKWARTMEILVPDSFSNFKNWEKTKVENRGAEYKTMKDAYADEIINYVSGFYPELKNAIQHRYTATGLTVRDYFGNPDGAIYGQQGLYIPVKTKIENLFMTGQAVQNQGVCGAVVSSVLTAETILQKSLIEEIAKA